MPAKVNIQTITSTLARAIVLGALAVTIYIAIPPQTSSSEEHLADTPQIYRIVLESSINPATADFIREAIAKAKESGARALIIQMDTPGGLLESTKLIVKDLLGAPLPTIVYVGPSGASATSAGVFITLAANIAAMAPGTTIGAAHPVGGQGETIEGDMREKVENFAASLVKSIAEKRGRNADWAEKAVRESVSITEREALEKNVIDIVATDINDLVKQIDGRQVTIDGEVVTVQTKDAAVVDGDMSLKQRIINMIADPNIAYLLMMAAMLGLYVEFTNPGLFFPGIVGAISLVLALTALQVIPINNTGLALIILGMLLLGGELFVPSFGLLGIGGIIAFILGSLLVFESPTSDLHINTQIVYAAGATLGLLVLITGVLITRSQRRKVSLGREGIIGETGEVRRTIGRKGTQGLVHVHGEYWKALTDDDDEIAVGEEVVVLANEGMTVRVRKRNPEQ